MLSEYPSKVQKFSMTFIKCRGKTLAVRHGKKDENIQKEKGRKAHEKEHKEKTQRHS